MNVTQLFATQSDAVGWHTGYGTSRISSGAPGWKYCGHRMAVGTVYNKNKAKGVMVFGPEFETKITIPRRSQSRAPQKMHLASYSGTPNVKFVWGSDHSNVTLALRPMEFQKMPAVLATLDLCWIVI